MFLAAVLINDLHDGVANPTPVKVRVSILVRIQLMFAGFWGLAQILFYKKTKEGRSTRRVLQAADHDSGLGFIAFEVVCKGFF